MTSARNRALWVLLVALATGCVPAKRPQPAKAVADAKQEPAAKEESKAEPKVEEPFIPPPIAGPVLDQAAQHLARGELELAKKALEALAGRKADLEAPQLAEFERLTALAEKSAAPPKEIPVPKEVPELTEAKKLAAAEQWEDALKALDPFLAKAAEGEPKREAAALREQVERQLANLRELREAVEKLGASGPEAEAARKRLWRDSERSLPLLLAGMTSDNPAQLGGILEMLRMRNEPAATLPAVLGLLERADAQAMWPMAVGELGRLRRPGAGERLLKVALESKKPEQRAAALQALAGVVDPPEKTLRVLLPLLHQDGPELAPALAAAAGAAFRHRQQDLVTGRVLRGGLSGDERKQLAALPARLKALAEGLKVTPRPTSAVPAAMLATALGIERPSVISGVRVVGVCGEEINGPAAGAVDGVWDTPDIRTRNAWYDAGTVASASPWIVLDLGSERTLAGVRIWNFNGAGITERGWRDVDIYVSDDLAEGLPAASGFVPKAPGRKDYGDFSEVIPVPFARGRYVKLQARSLWSDQKNSGLSEVQMLGW